jgi:hypothetical protein
VGWTQQRTRAGAGGAGQRIATAIANANMENGCRKSNPIRIPVDFHDAIRREPGKGRDASSVRFRFRIPGLEAWPD